MQQKLYIWHNGIDWVIARSALEAKDVLKKCYGFLDEDLEEDESWSPLADNDELTIFEEGCLNSKTTLTAAAWIREVGEPSFLCSSEL